MRVTINLHSGSTPVVIAPVVSRCLYCIHKHDPIDFCLQHDQKRREIKEGPKCTRMIVVECSGFEADK